MLLMDPTRRSMVVTLFLAADSACRRNFCEWKKRGKESEASKSYIVSIAASNTVTWIILDLLASCFSRPLRKEYLI